MRVPRWVRELSVARQILLLQALVVVVLVLVSLTLAGFDARRDARDAATTRAVAVALAVADSPTVVSAVRSPDPCSTLQPYAERVRLDADVDFVVVMGAGPHALHPPDESPTSASPSSGDLGDAPEGASSPRSSRARSVPSMRAVVPVVDGDEVVALVSVGITIASIDRELRDDVVIVLLVALAVLLAGLLGAWLVSRRLRRQTHGMGEREITRMYEYYSAVLHAVREGLLLVDAEGRVQLVNDEARGCWRSTPTWWAAGSTTSAWPRAGRGRAGRDPETDDLYVAGDRILVVSSSPASWDGRDVGAVVTLRDHTELRSVTGELDAVRGLTDSLRSQTHEAANRLHTVVSLIEMGRAARRRRVRHHRARGRPAAHRRGRRCRRRPGRRGPAARQERRGGRAGRGPHRDRRLPQGQQSVGVPARDLVTVLGNLVDNALDAVAGASVATGRRGARRATTQALTLDRRRQRAGPRRRRGRARARARLVDQGRGEAAASAWPWSRRSRGATEARCASAASSARWSRVRGDAAAEPGGGMSVRVLVVEDEQLAAEAHASYVGRVPGFELAGVARSAGEAARFLESDSRVDLLLLDMHLPDGHGLGLLQRLRAQGHLIDVIAVTSARDAEVVRHAVAQGVVLYLLKPFAFAAFRAKLEQYATYRDGLAAATPELAQDEVDRLMDPLRASAGLPSCRKG